MKLETEPVTALEADGRQPLHLVATRGNVERCLSGVISLRTRHIIQIRLENDHMLEGGDVLTFGTDQPPAIFKATVIKVAMRNCLAWVTEESVLGISEAQGLESSSPLSALLSSGRWSEFVSISKIWQNGLSVTQDQRVVLNDELNVSVSTGITPFEFGARVVACQHPVRTSHVTTRLLIDRIEPGAAARWMQLVQSAATRRPRAQLNS